MDTHAEKISENRSQAAAGSLTGQPGNNYGYAFEDNRPATIAQRKQLESINSNPHVQQLQVYHKTTDSSFASSGIFQLSRRSDAEEHFQNLLTEFNTYKAKYNELMGEFDTLRPKISTLKDSYIRNRLNNHIKDLAQYTEFDAASGFSWGGYKILKRNVAILRSKNGLGDLEDDNAPGLVQTTLKQVNEMGDDREAELGDIWGKDEQIHNKDADNDIVIGSVGAPTDNKAWRNVKIDEKVKLLEDAMDRAFLQWQKSYNPQATYIFTAPEYFLSGEDSHFIDNSKAKSIQDTIRSKMSYLPSNFLVVPGTIGWKEILKEREYDRYMEQHTRSKEMVNAEMNANALGNDEKREINYQFDNEASAADRSTGVTVYHNTASVYQGGQKEKEYHKRYESTTPGADDRTEKIELENGVFHLGNEAFTTNINGIPIKLEVCSDNAYDSIKGANYQGVHILLAADFGGFFESSIHGHTFIATDSKKPAVHNQSDNNVPANREDAGNRDFNNVDAEEVLTHENNKEVSLHFFRTAKRGPYV